eukprot:549487-Hanusia_phi.AAC.8
MPTRKETKSSSAWGQIRSGALRILLGGDALTYAEAAFTNIGTESTSCEKRKIDSLSGQM